MVPSTKRRWWSRPLVGLLFFLQPIVRGWARYQGRLAPRPRPLAPQHTLDSIALRNGRLDLREVQYWAEQRLDRLTWVTAILRRLDDQGWPNKADTGWNDYDVEVYDTRWTRVQLTTVAEEHPEGKQLIRCRLRGRWALRTKVAFWSLCGVELLVCGLWQARLPWVWSLLVTLPLLAWYFSRQQRNLQSMIMVFLDDLAGEWHLAKVPPQPGEAAPGRRPSS